MQVRRRQGALWESGRHGVYVVEVERLSLIRHQARVGVQLRFALVLAFAMPQLPGYPRRKKGSYLKHHGTQYIMRADGRALILWCALRPSFVAILLEQSAREVNVALLTASGCEAPQILRIRQEIEKASPHPEAGAFVLLDLPSAVAERHRIQRLHQVWMGIFGSGRDGFAAVESAPSLNEASCPHRVRDEVRDDHGQQGVAVFFAAQGRHSKGERGNVRRPQRADRGTFEAEKTLHVGSLYRSQRSDLGR